MRWPILLLIGLVACQVGLPDESNGSTPIPQTATPTPQIGVNFVTRARPTTAVSLFQPPTATPLPTPTITPTATPIVYEIQAGDTLLDLAIQQGVTVANIEALNPDLRPELLQIGQQVVLPPRATAVFLLGDAARSTPIPLQIALTQLQLYQMPTGAAWIVGEVLNEGEFAAEAVQVTLSLLSGAGEAAAEATQTVPIWVASSIIPPQTKAPFGILLPSVPDSAQPAAVVSGGQTLVDVGSRYLDLAVEEVEVEAETAVLTATLHNQGEATATDIRLIATLYDQAETIIGFVQHDFAAEELDTGERLPFSLSLVGRGETAVSYTFHAEALQKP
ncbi:MAG: LysM domain-containing protein [Chloroflexota bacterium]